MISGLSHVWDSYSIYITPHKISLLILVKKLCPFPIRSQKSKPRHIKELRELADRNVHPEDFEDEEEESVLVSE